jgi:hypothetical protein
VTRGATAISNIRFAAKPASAVDHAPVNLSLRIVPISTIAPVIQRLG